MGRQTVTALGTLVALAVAFLGYEQTLGRLTDFEPIDPRLLHPMDDVAIDPSKQSKPEDQIAAERAFGPAEAQRLQRYKMYQAPKSVFAGGPTGRGLGLFIYFDKYELNKDGDAKLVEFSPIILIYITGPASGDGSRDDIYTAKADRAMIRFDRDVELTKGPTAKPIAGWIEGDVQLGSNQGTTPVGDDVRVLTHRLDYEQAKSKIWSPGYVQVVSNDGTQMSGEGLEIELEPERSRRPVGKGKRASDVRQLTLMKKVKFHLLVDEDQQFLGGGEGTKVAALPNAPKAKKAPLDVTSRGPFVYDVSAMKAVFDVGVEVERKHNDPAQSRDRLLCENLTLQFVEKAAAKAPTSVVKKSESGGLTSAQEKTSLSTVEAVGPPEGVVLIAESQKLRAIGDYLFHDADKKQTTLRSAQKMVVLQDNVRIEGRSLVLNQSTEKSKDGKIDVREAVVEGPNGLLEVVDKQAPAGKPVKELLVRFNKRLKATPEANGKSRMVVIDGGIELEIPKQPLMLTSESLLVRLEEATAPGQPKEAKAPTKFEPTWIQAQRSVTVTSPELDVAAGQSLTMHILNDDGKVAVLPERAERIREEDVKPAGFFALPEPQNQAKAKTATNPPAAGDAKQPGKQSFVLGLGDSRQRDPKKPADKVDLRAETVEVFAVKVGGKTEARRAEALGNVFIRRDAGANEPEQAVEIKGDRAEFFRSPKGDRMIVHGGTKPAEIVNKKFHLEDCQHIDLDEGANVMTVTGAGHLTLLGAALVNATDAPKQARSSDKPFKVWWTEKMVFDGLNAQFDGKVQSEQYSQRVEPIEEYVRQMIGCEKMTVYFKDRLSFRGAKGESAKKMEVRKVVCDRNVMVDETIYHPPPGQDPAGHLFRYSGIRASALFFDNVLREVEAYGPGARAGFIERAKPRTNAEGKPEAPSLPFVRTEVTQFGKMTYRQDSKTVNLMESVKVIRSPVETTGEKLNFNKLRPEAVSMDAQSVQLLERADAEGRKQHDFNASGEVSIFTKEYNGLGDEATYDQARDRVVLKGAPAFLQKIDRPGVESPSTTAAAIEYYIKEGRTKVVDAGRGANIDLGTGLKGVKPPNVPVGGQKNKK